MPRVVPGTISIALIVALSVIGLLGCGAASKGDGGCELAAIGARIHLQNSGLSCMEAQSIVFLMAGGESNGREVIKGPMGAWVCNGHTDGKAGDTKRRCTHGERHFVVER